MASRALLRAAVRVSSQQPLWRSTTAVTFPLRDRLRIPEQSRRSFASSSSALFWPFTSSSSPSPASPLVTTPPGTNADAAEVGRIAPDATVAPESTLPPPTLSATDQVVTSTASPDAVADAASTSLHHLQTSLGSIPTGTLDLTSLPSSWGLHPIMRLQSLFLQLHESFPIIGTPGLQWCILIPVVTVGARSILFWFQVRSQRNAAKLAIIQPQMLQNMEKLKAAKKVGDMQGQQAAQIQTQQLMREHGVNPIMNLVFPLSQAVVFMTMFFALRGISGAGLLSMQTEGLAWFTDLTAPDPKFALPLLSTAITLASLEAGIDSSTQVQTTTTKNMKMFFRAALVLSLPFIAYFPAGVLLYWVTNNFVSLIQSVTLRQKGVRSFFNIPTVPPKKQPGEVGYVPEPSFSEAFKNMQVGAQEKIAAASEQAEARQALVRQRKLEDAMPAGFRPRKPPTSPAIRVLEETSASITSTPAPTDSNAAPASFVPRSSAVSLEEEKAQRVLAARRRRLKNQGSKS